jgi:hypothetical protein
MQSKEEKEISVCCGVIRNHINCDCKNDICKRSFCSKCGKPFIPSIEKEKEKKCYSCNGKGFYTQMYGIEGFPDFFGDKGFEEKPTIHKHKCSACNGTGKVNKNNLSNSPDLVDKEENIQKDLTYKPSPEEAKKIEATLPKVDKEEVKLSAVTKELEGVNQSQKENWEEYSFKGENPEKCDMICDHCVCWCGQEYACCNCGLRFIPAKWANDSRTNLLEEVREANLEKLAELEHEQWIE